MANVKRVRLAGRETQKKRRGLDPKKDFEKPTRKEPEQISAEELQATSNAAAEMPARIVNGFMAVNFVRFHPEVEKDKRSFGLEFSIELTDDHLDYLPKKVHDGWDDIEARGYKRVDLVGIPMQRFDLCLVPDDKETDLSTDAPIEKVVLSVIEDKGTGDAKDIIRLSFRLVCDLTQTVERFACRNFGNTVWLRTTAVQGELNL
jgi:hypothetical protein